MYPPLYLLLSSPHLPVYLSAPLPNTTLQAILPPAQMLRAVLQSVPGNTLLVSTILCLQVVYFVCSPPSPRVLIRPTDTTPRPPQLCKPCPIATQSTVPGPGLTDIILCLQAEKLWEKYALKEVQRDLTPSSPHTS